jgi:hypothetical protein
MAGFHIEKPHSFVELAGKRRIPGLNNMPFGAAS